jgi:hypothetical protein
MAGAMVLLTSCGSSENKPKAAQPGTPEFNWLKAKEAYKRGDYETANNLLTQLAQKENPYQTQAMPMALVLTHGIGSGYLELADKYETGAKKARANQMGFRRLIGEYKAKATAAGKSYTELAMKFSAMNKGQDVTLVLEVPDAPGGDPPQYKKIESGNMIPEAEVPQVASHVVKREAMMSACMALGAKANPTKAKSAYVNGEAKAPADTFYFAMAESLYETAESFGPKKLMQPARFIEALLNEAEGALKLVKETKESKALLTKIKEAKKKLVVT